MLRRARRALGETESRALGTVCGGAFHSVANRLLRAYGEAIGLDPDFTVVDQSDAEDLMDASRHNLAWLKRETVPRKQTCLSIYSRCVNSSDPPRSYAGGVLSVVHRVGAGAESTIPKQSRHGMYSTTTISSSIGFTCLATRRS